jgi:glycosyltransferase involved in cell wall biosynthesis
MPKISIILPCYNGARWISQAIESVLAQTYEDFELVVVDDGSRDNSREIVSTYLHDERIRYIYQENKGFSGALNRGIRESRGEFIGFIGQDDLYMPNKLQVQVQYFDEHKDADLVHSGYCSIDSNGRIIGVYMPNKLQVQYFDRYKDAKLSKFSSRQKMIRYLFINNFIGFETVLVRRNCFDEVGLFDERMTGFSDHDMWLRIAGKFNIGYIDLILVKKREHKMQLSKMAFEECLQDEFLIASKAIKEYPFLKKDIRKKLSNLYYRWGITMLEKGMNKEAKQKFFKVIRYTPWKFKAIMAYITPTMYRFIWERYRRSASKIRSGLKWIEG